MKTFAKYLKENVDRGAIVLNAQTGALDNGNPELWALISQYAFDNGILDQHIVDGASRAKSGMKPTSRQIQAAYKVVDHAKGGMMSGWKKEPGFRGTYES